MPHPSRLRLVLRALRARIRVGADPERCVPGTLVLLPVRPAGRLVPCGIAAFVEIAGGAAQETMTTAGATEAARHVIDSGLGSGHEPSLYAGGEATLDTLTTWARGLKQRARFAALFTNEAERDGVLGIAADLRSFADGEDARLAAAADTLSEDRLETLAARVLRVRDVAWHIENEALSLLQDVRSLSGDGNANDSLVANLRRLSAVFRSIDRIEIRGRDSAGVAVQVTFPGTDARAGFFDAVDAAGLRDALNARSALADLPALSVCVAPESPVVTFVYKVAAEVGRLGDNVAELSRQARSDALLRLALSADEVTAVVLGHTRWASSGVISIPNCHPIDNETVAGRDRGVRSGRVFVVMNGDVDNHLELRADYEHESGRTISAPVTTDTKVVALEIERHLIAGDAVLDAFRKACARFDGSCAIGMVTDLAPGRIFTSLRGSGQSLYVGVSLDGFFASSEVYGLVEETSQYVKMDGEAERVAGDTSTSGQVIVMASDVERGAAGLRRLGFDGTELPVGDDDVREAEITTRDVDRGDFDHFFRKEITQASRSAERTLLGRVVHGPNGSSVAPHLLSEAVRTRFASGSVRRMYVAGQGTAAMAGAGIAEYVRRVVPMGDIRVEALPATELSGFRLVDDMSDTVVVAVTQSGSTADTNRAIDLARKRGALVVAIVNRRNSDVTYRADGVIYTSDGRDVEMSVASTKAFYSQIVAGGLFALAVAQVLGSLDVHEIARELAELERLPELMQRVLDNEDAVQAAAEKHAPTREHWAVVASGPNHVAAREVRIKLSELCYKSIAVDTVEDKKHIDLSSEPMTIVLAAGNPESVQNDVVKDVAIFKAHKGCAIVFCSEGETRFDPYAAAVVHLPDAPALSSMVLSALAGHLFGYHAARAIDGNARFLAGVRAVLVGALEDPAQRDDLPAKMTLARREFLTRLESDRFTSALNPVTAARLAMLFDRVTGAAVMDADTRAFVDGDGEDSGAVLVNVLGDALDQCQRPIDAIKHQAKIVTVGTSRPEAEVPSVIATALQAAGVDVDRVAPIDVLELHRVGPALAAVAGVTAYEIDGLRADGTPDDNTRIRVASRTGIAAGMSSRALDWTALIGTKRHVVASRRLHIGVGMGDGRRIAIVPLRGGTAGVNGLALLHLEFVVTLPVSDKKRVLGARLADLRDLIAEANRSFTPDLLEHLSPEQVVLETPEDLAGRLLSVQ